MSKTLKDVLARGVNSKDETEIASAIHLFQSSARISPNKDFIVIEGTDSRGKKTLKNFHFTKIDALIDEAKREGSMLLGDLHAIKNSLYDDHGVLKVRNDGPKPR